MNESKVFELIIIGGGPAGLSAGIYAQRAGIDTLLIEKDLPGGQVNEAPTIENYPGFMEISGMDLALKMKEHALSTGLPIEPRDVKNIEDGDLKTIKTDKGDLKTKTVIVATGAKPKRLEIKGEREFLGRGVSYCGTCDGFFFRNKTVVAIGGGDRAVKESLYLSNIVEKVYLIHRRGEFRAEKINVERLKKKDNVEFILNSTVEEIVGDQKVDNVIIANVQTQKTSELKTDGVFVFVGVTPRNNLLEAEKDKSGFLITDSHFQTSIKGIFAAGDCRSTAIKQVIIAAGEGASALTAVEDYLQSF